MPLPGGLGALTSGTVGVGVGLAASAALEPIIELPRQESWSKNAHRVLAPAIMARLYAQGALDLGTAQAEALRSGIDGPRTALLAYLEQQAVPVAEALELWRREKIGEPLVDHALAKAQIDPRYWAAVKELFQNRLDPAVIAVAIQRGIMTDPGFLPVGPPSAEGKVPKFPVSALDSILEAQASGIDRDRLFVETAIVGNPASPDLAARMTFRGIIDKPDYDRAIAEGNTRNEWANVLFDGFREILTANQWAELHLRGWITAAEMYAGTALHGMSRENTDQLYRVLGRPLAVHQITTGLARGGKFSPQPGELTDPYEVSVRQSNVRPEFYDLAIANKYTYPSAFVLRALTQGGDLTQAQSHQTLLDIGWPPALAETVSVKWAQGTGSKVKEETASNLRAEYEGMHITRAELVTALEGLGYPTAEASALADLGDYARVKKYRDAVVTATYKAFVGHLIQEADARADLAQIGISPEAVDDLLAVWKVELAVARKGLTQAQIKSAYKKAIIDLPTALQELQDKGLSQADATTYLNE